MHNSFFGLNETQLEAVKTIEGAYLVLAGAGSGKTRVVTLRIVNLIQEGIPPSKILAVTFTNKATQEMRSRITQLTQDLVTVCTFHSLGAKILRESIGVLGYSSHFTIYDEEDVDKLLRSCMMELGLLDLKSELKTFRNLISQSKNALKSPQEVTSESLEDLDLEVAEAFVKIYTHYQVKLKDYEAIDFDDLLYLPVKIWKEFPEVLARYQARWSFILIDEYQDTNPAQYLMARLLVDKSKNIFVVGDPDQSIYSWRGAHIGNILNFEKDYPGAQVIRLEQNYRSTSNILNLANDLISYNQNRYEKELWSELGEGEKVKLFIGEDDRQEADFVATQTAYHKAEHHISYKDMVIFYRTNAQSRVFEDSLLNRHIPYVIIGGISFYQRREIKDILAFLRMAQSGTDYMAFLRTINIPKRGFGEASVERIRHGANLERLTIMGYCQAINQNLSLQNPCKISAKLKVSLAEYTHLIQELHEMSKTHPICELVKTAIDKSGYIAYLKEDKETFLDRRENLDQLITKAIEWETTAPVPTLEAFLEELSLKSNLDELQEDNDRLNLMTIHNGKGLEFEVTFLVGLEEDLFPHVNSKNSLSEVEEERRLCYVGVTRAKKHLYLSHCRLRYLWGNLRRQAPSRFLKEMPAKYMERFSSAANKIAKIFSPNKSTHSQPPAASAKNIQLPTSEEFTVNDLVFHTDFGTGQIKETNQGSMGLTYKIQFNKDNHLRTLVAKYAVLIRMK